MKTKIRKIMYLSVGICFIALCTLVVAPSAYRNRSDKSDARALTASANLNVEKDTLKDFILEHEQLRSLQLNELDEIVMNETSSQEIKESAQKQKLEILKLLETESTIAGILQARGYSDAAVAANAEYINILISALQASETDVARIKELVVTQTDVDSENIKIIPIN